MSITKQKWKALTGIGGVALIMNDEKQSILDCFDAAGFTLTVSKPLVDYCLTYAAVTGLTWSATSNYLYPTIDRESGLVYVAHTYRADCQLAYTKGGLVQLQAWSIREGDEVLIAAGDNVPPSIKQSSLSPNRGAIKGGVASGALKCGMVVNAFVKKEDILKAIANGTEAWNTVFIDEMIKKTAIWQILNNIPNLKRELSINVDKYCSPLYPKKNNIKIRQTRISTEYASSIGESVAQVRVNAAMTKNLKKYQSTGLVYQTPTLLKFVEV